MKKEIKCPRCRRRIQKEDAYCQYCGCHVAEEKKKKRKKKHNLLLKHKEVGVPRKAFGPSQLLFISDHRCFNSSDSSSIKNILR